MVRGSEGRHRIRPIVDVSGLSRNPKLTTRNPACAISNACHLTFKSVRKTLNLESQNPSTQGESRKYVIPCVVIIILFTNIVLGQGTAPLLHFLGIRTGVEPEPDDNDTRERAQQGGVGGTGPLGFARERFDSGSVSKRIIKRTSMLLSRGTLGDAPAHQVEDSVGVLRGGGHGVGGSSRRALAINEFVHPRVDTEGGERERERGDIGVDADEPTDARYSTSSWIGFRPCVSSTLRLSLGS